MNYLSLINLKKFCDLNNIFLIHFSTDYVFLMEKIKILTKKIQSQTLLINMENLKLKEKKLY